MLSSEYGGGLRVYVIDKVNGVNGVSQIFHYG